MIAGMTVLTIICYSCSKAFGRNREERIIQFIDDKYNEHLIFLIGLVSIVIVWFFTDIINTVAALFLFGSPITSIVKVCLPAIKYLVKHNEIYAFKRRYYAAVESE